MKIVLASAQLDLRLAMEILLREEPGAEIVGTASEAASVRSLLQSSRPDLVILDWDLPGYSPLLLPAEAKRIRRNLQVIVFGRDEEVRQEVLAAGADAFVLADDLPDDLVATVRQSLARHRERKGTAAGLRSGTLPVAAGGQILDGTEEE